MSSQLLNPKAKKLVNVNQKQIATLKKAGWLVPNDPKAVKILENAEKEEKEET